METTPMADVSSTPSQLSYVQQKITTTTTLAPAEDITFPSTTPTATTQVSYTQSIPEADVQSIPTFTTTQSKLFSRFKLCFRYNGLIDIEFSI
jgi:hypothetical protein